MYVCSGEHEGITDVTDRLLSGPQTFYFAPPLTTQLLSELARSQHCLTHTKQFGSHLRLLHGLGRLGRHVPDPSMVPVRSKCYIASHEFVVAVEAASLLFFCLYKIPGGFVRTLLLYQLLHCLIIRLCYPF